MILFIVGITTLFGVIVYAATRMIPINTPQQNYDAQNTGGENAVNITPDETPEFLQSDSDDISSGAVGGISATMFPTIGFETASVAATPLDFIFTKYGTLYNVDPRLLKALAMVESSMNPNAVRNNPPHDVSMGLMQILCLPDGKGGCTNKFNIDGWKGVTAQALLSPDLNVKLGAQIIAWNIRTFGYKRGIAVYNNWSARNSPADGPFPNQGYVNKVLSNVAKL